MYYGYARSNYFEVKNEEKFAEFLDLFGNLELIKDNKGRVGFLVDSVHGGIPFERYDENNDKYYEINFNQELSEHLKDGEVAIYKEIGSEKLRYFIAYAVAVNSKGEVREVSIEDIYDIATKELGGNSVTTCSN